MDISTAILFSFEEMVYTLIDRDRETERQRETETETETETERDRKRQRESTTLQSQIAYQKVGVSFTS